MTLFGVGLRHIGRPVSVMRRCWSGAKIICPGRYTVKMTQVRSCLCRHLCDQKSLEKVEVIRTEEQEVVENPQEPPKSLPLPSQEFLDLLDDRQLDHYKSVLDKYENHWRINLKDVKVPSVLTDSNWRYILGFGKSRTLTILSKLHYRETMKKKKKETKCNETKLQEKDQNVIMHNYSIPTHSSQKTFKILKTYQAMEYGEELVFDLGFKSDAEVGHIFREEKRIRKQLQDIIHENSRRRNPFHLVFCNVNKRTRSMLEEVAGDIPITITDQCYLTMFSKNDLVYLSPDGRTDLGTYNHKYVYIVGCITDLVTKPLTKNKAQTQGIRYMRFPIRRYLGNTSSCILTLNQVTSMLHDLKDTGDWMTALKHVPQRFRNPEENCPKERKEKKKMFSLQE